MTVRVSEGKEREESEWSGEEDGCIALSIIQLQVSERGKDRGIGGWARTVGGELKQEGKEAMTSVQCFVKSIQVEDMPTSSMSFEATESDIRYRNRDSSPESQDRIKVELSNWKRQNAFKYYAWSQSTPEKKSTHIP